VGCNGFAGLLHDTVICVQDYWRQISANISIMTCQTAYLTSFLRPVVRSASLLSATAIFWRLAIVSIFWEISVVQCSCATPAGTLNAEISSADTKGCVSLLEGLNWSR